MSDFNSGNYSGDSSNYEIASVDALENSASNLANYNQQITSNVKTLEYIISAVRENWQNESGNDIESIMANLNSADKTLTETIQPVISKYVETLNQIVLDTRATQSREIY